MSMEENPSRSRTKNRAHNARHHRSSSSRSASSSSSATKASSSSSSRSQGRFRRTWETREAEDHCSVECSGKSCQACSATIVADCVALCCCPLAVVSLLVLTFIKVPYLMGRKCIGRRKKRSKKKPKDVAVGAWELDGDCSGEMNGIKGMERSRDIVFEFGEGEMLEQRKSLCTGLSELDNVLLELYQVGHLGFGRVSFTGIQPSNNCMGV